MEREKSWQQITNTGRSISQGWQDLARKYGLPLELGGLSALKNFSIPLENGLKYKTLITQEMLKQGFLASNTVYSCIDHTDQVVTEYFEKLDPILALIAECEDDRAIDDLLEGPVCQSGFRRLN